MLDSLLLAGTAAPASSLPPASRPRRHSHETGHVRPTAPARPTELLERARPWAGALPLLAQLVGTPPEPGPLQFAALRPLLRALTPWQSPPAPLWPDRPPAERLALHLQALCYVQQATLRTWHHPERYQAVSLRLQLSAASLLLARAAALGEAPSPVLAWLCAPRDEVQRRGQFLWLQLLARADCLSAGCPSALTVVNDYGVNWLQAPGWMSEPIALYDLTATDLRLVLEPLARTLAVADGERGLRRALHWPAALPLFLTGPGHPAARAAVSFALSQWAADLPPTAPGGRRGLLALADALAHSGGTPRSAEGSVVPSPSRPVPAPTVASAALRSTPAAFLPAGSALGSAATPEDETTPDFEDFRFPTLAPVWAQTATPVRAPTPPPTTTPNRTATPSPAATPDPVTKPAALAAPIWVTKPMAAASLARGAARRATPGPQKSAPEDPAFVQVVPAAAAPEPTRISPAQTPSPERATRQIYSRVEFAGANEAKEPLGPPRPATPPSPARPPSPRWTIATGRAAAGRARQATGAADDAAGKGGLAAVPSRTTAQSPASRRRPSAHAPVAALEPVGSPGEDAAGPLRPWPRLLAACEEGVIEKAEIARQLASLGKDVLPLVSLRRWAGVWARATASGLPQAGPALDIVRHIARQHGGRARFATECAHAAEVAAGHDVALAWQLHQLLADAALAEDAPLPPASAVPLLLRAPPASAAALELAAERLLALAEEPAALAPLAHGEVPALHGWLQNGATGEPAAHCALAIRKHSEQWVDHALQALSQAGTDRLLCSASLHHRGYARALQATLRRLGTTDAEKSPSLSPHEFFSRLISHWRARSIDRRQLFEFVVLASNALQDQGAYSQWWRALAAADLAPQPLDFSAMRLLALPPLAHLQAVQNAMAAVPGLQQHWLNVLGAHLYAATHSPDSGRALRVLHLCAPWDADNIGAAKGLFGHLQSDLIYKFSGRASRGEHFDADDAELWWQILRRCDHTRCLQAASRTVSSNAVWDALAESNFFLDALVHHLPAEKLATLLNMRPFYLDRRLMPPKTSSDPTGLLSLRLCQAALRPEPIFAHAKRISFGYNVALPRAREIAAATWLHRRLCAQKDLLTGDEAEIIGATVGTVRFDAQQVRQVLAGNFPLYGVAEQRVFRACSEAFDILASFAIETLAKRFSERGVRTLAAKLRQPASSATASADMDLLFDTIIARHALAPFGAGEDTLVACARQVAEQPRFAERLFAYLERQSEALAASPVKLITLLPLVRLMGSATDTARARQAVERLMLQLGASPPEVPGSSLRGRVSINARAEILAACASTLFAGRNGADVSAMMPYFASLALRSADKSPGPSYQLLRQIYFSEAAKAAAGGPVAYCLQQVREADESLWAVANREQQLTLWRGLCQLTVYVAPDIADELALGLADLLHQRCATVKSSLSPAWVTFVAESPLFCSSQEDRVARASGLTSNLQHPLRKALVTNLRRSSADALVSTPTELREVTDRIEGEWLEYQRRRATEALFAATDAQAATVFFKQYISYCADVDLHTERRTTPVLNQRLYALLASEGMAAALNAACAQLPNGFGAKQNQLRRLTGTFDNPLAGFTFHAATSGLPRS